jgi:hypothetical protein
MSYSARQKLIKIRRELPEPWRAGERFIDWFIPVFLIVIISWAIFS